MRITQPMLLTLALMTVLPVGRTMVRITEDGSNTHQELTENGLSGSHPRSLYNPKDGIFSQLASNVESVGGQPGEISDVNEEHALDRLKQSLKNLEEKVNGMNFKEEFEKSLEGSPSGETVKETVQLNHKNMKRDWFTIKLNAQINSEDLVSNGEKAKWAQWFFDYIKTNVTQEHILNFNPELMQDVQEKFLKSLEDMPLGETVNVTVHLIGKNMKRDWPSNKQNDSILSLVDYSISNVIRTQDPISDANSENLASNGDGAVRASWLFNNATKKKDILRGPLGLVVRHIGNISDVNIEHALDRPKRSLNNSEDLASNDKRKVWVQQFLDYMQTNHTKAQDQFFNLNPELMQDVQEKFLKNLENTSYLEFAQKIGQLLGENMTRDWPVIKIDYNGTEWEWPHAINDYVLSSVNRALVNTADVSLKQVLVVEEKFLKSLDDTPMGQTVNITVHLIDKNMKRDRSINKQNSSILSPVDYSMFNIIRTQDPISDTNSEDLASNDDVAVRANWLVNDATRKKDMLRGPLGMVIRHLGNISDMEHAMYRPKRSLNNSEDLASDDKLEVWVQQFLDDMRTNVTKAQDQFKIYNLNPELMRDVQEKNVGLENTPLGKTIIQTVNLTQVPILDVNLEDSTSNGDGVLRVHWLVNDANRKMDVLRGPLGLVVRHLSDISNGVSGVAEGGTVKPLQDKSVIMV